MTEPSSHARRRDAILQAAASRFVRDGYDETTVDSIAADAGVSRATVFNRFAGKRALLLALYDSQLDGVLARLAERPAGAPLLGQLGWFFRAGESQLREDGELTAILYREVLHDPQMLAHDESRGAQVRKVLEEIVRDGQRQGQLSRTLRPAVIASLFMDCWTAAVGRWVASGRKTALASAVLQRVRIIIRGVAAAKTSSVRRKS